MKPLASRSCHVEDLKTFVNEDSHAALHGRIVMADFAAGIEATNVFMLVITLIITQMRVVARHMIELISELFAEGTQQQFQSKIKNELRPIAMKYQPMCRFM